MAEQQPEDLRRPAGEIARAAASRLSSRLAEAMPLEQFLDRAVRFVDRHVDEDRHAG